MESKQVKQTGVVWVGAALGLYFGLFFRPMREPNLGLAVGLALLAAVITTLIRVWQTRRFEPGAVVKETAVSWAQYALFLGMLEGRHLAYVWGGKTAVILMTTVLGALSGLWYAYTHPAPDKRRETP